MRNPVDPVWIVTTTVFLPLTISLSVVANPFQQWFSRAFCESQTSITSRPKGRVMQLVIFAPLNKDERVGCNFESTSNVTDFMEAHPRKHSSQITSTDEGM
jgi:hypothetical protein